MDCISIFSVSGSRRGATLGEHVGLACKSTQIPLVFYAREKHPTREITSRQALLVSLGGFRSVRIRHKKIHVTAPSRPHCGLFLTFVAASGIFRIFLAPKSISIWTFGDAVKASIVHLSRLPPLHSFLSHIYTTCTSASYNWDGFEPQSLQMKLLDISRVVEPKVWLHYWTNDYTHLGDRPTN